MAATLVVGCVDLKKPESVELCAAQSTCYDDPSKPKRDAKEDAEELGADVLPKDAPADAADAAADIPMADAPADRAADTTDATGPDLVEVGMADTLDGGVEAGPEVGPDRPPDGRPDLGVDLPRDLGRDLPPDVGKDVAVDVGPDVAPDLPPDLAPDLPPPDTAPPGLLAYYPCETATGTTLPDNSGKRNNGTLSAGGTSFVTGKMGKALSLVKNSSGSVSLPVAMFANVTDVTIAAWVNVTSVDSWARIIDVGVNANRADNQPTGTHYMNLVPKNAGTNLAFSISANGYDNEQVLLAAALPTGVWKHVAVVLGAGTGGLYVDGTLATGIGSVTLRPKDLGAIDYAYLGKSQFSVDPYFDGLLDDVRVYGRALSADEIKALATAP